MDIEAVLMK